MVLGETSAPGYFFSRDLHLSLGVPVGLIDPSWGGTHIESWIAGDTWKPWNELIAIYNSLAPAEEDNKHALSHVFNHGVNPFVGFSLRGFIWHQGEGNAMDGDLYRLKLHALITGYRKIWNDANLHFGIGQLYPYLSPHFESVEQMDKFCETSLAQVQATLEIPQTGAIILNDLGHPLNIHPDEKLKQGTRYALWARATVYREDGLVHCGPIARKAVRGKDGKVRVYFDHVGSGLATRDGRAPIWLDYEYADPGEIERPPRQMEISEDGTHLVLDPPGRNNPKPIRIRMGWHTFGQHNLMNAEGLPASIFNLPIENE
jgi:hypothetical protein